MNNTKMANIDTTIDHKEFTDICKTLHLGYEIASSGERYAEVWSEHVGMLGTIESERGNWSWAPGFDMKVDELAQASGIGTKVCEHFLTQVMEFLDQDIDL